MGFSPTEPYTLYQFLQWQLYTNALFSLQIYGGEVDPTRFVAKRRKIAYEPVRHKTDKTASTSPAVSGGTSDVGRNDLITFRPQTDVAKQLPNSSEPSDLCDSSMVQYSKPGCQRKRTHEGAPVRTLRSIKRGARLEGEEEEEEKSRVPHPHLPWALSWKQKNGVEESQTHMGHVYPEILEGIFKLLDLQSLGRAAQVSSRWRNIAYRKSMWKNVTARIHIKKSSYVLYSSLVRRGINCVQVLSMRRSLKEVVNGMPRLEVLNLSGCYNLSETILEYALNKELPCLKSLDLSLCRDITDSSLGKIATHCKNLEELNLAGCIRVSNSGVLLISWGLKKLKKLNLRSCKRISDFGIESVLGDQGSWVKGFHPNLEELVLQDCQKITDESLHHIGSGLPNLKKLNLSFCINITNSGLRCLSDMPGLEDINLTSCDNISDVGMTFLGQGKCKLTALNVSFTNGLTDSGFKNIAASLRGLKKLEMSNCNSVSEASLLRLVANLKDLRVLHVGQNQNMTDKVVEVICQTQKNLSWIDLYGCPNVSEEAKKKLLQLPKLAELNMMLHLPAKIRNN